MKAIVITILAMVSFCAFYQTKSHKNIELSDKNLVGATPRFTTDMRGNPVLSWVEKAEEKAYFYFAISQDEGLTFGQKVKINVPDDLSVHAEGMPRIAFKADGSIWATFERKKPTKDAPRAADLLYVFSTDQGKTWSAPKPVHQDTTPGKGHSFSDMIRLSNGELGFVWLDEKIGNYEGRSVKFVQTLPTGGFSEEIVVDSNACQCCRTVLYLDHQNRVHIAYRDLLPDGTRDMSHVVSTDGGKTFSPPQLVLKDGWKINACPHTGPSMTQMGNDFFVTWFSGRSATHEAGIRVAKIGDHKLFSGVLSVRAKHPQITHYNEGLVVAWDESVQKGESYFTKIALKTIQKDGTTQHRYLSADFENATYPVLLSTKKGLLVAYELQKEEHKNTVIVSQLLSD